MKPWWGVLCLVLTATVFLSRWHGGTKPHPFSFDEDLHVVLAWDIIHSKSYSAKRFADHLRAGGKEVPPHYDQPFYAHPPAYALLLSLGMHGVSPDASEPLGFSLEHARRRAAVVNALLAASTVLLLWLLVRSRHGVGCAFLASALFAAEPISWMCQQRIWMENLMALTLLGVVFASDLRPSLRRVCLSCLFVLAVATKVWLLLVAFVWLYRLGPKEFGWRNLAVVVPAILLATVWMAWTHAASGVNFFLEEAVARVWQPDLLLVALVGFGVALVLWRRDFTIASRVGLGRPQLGTLVVGLVLIAVAPVFFLHGLGYLANLQFVPETSRASGFLHGWPMSTYVLRLLFFFPAFLFVFLASWRGTIRSFDGFLVLGCLLFLSAWGNYQCRYVAPLVPILCGWSAVGITHLWQGTKGANRLILLACLFAMAGKTANIVYRVVLPNDAFYF